MLTKNYNTMKMNLIKKFKNIVLCKIHFSCNLNSVTELNGC